MAIRGNTHSHWWNRSFMSFQGTLAGCRSGARLRPRCDRASRQEAPSRLAAAGDAFVLTELMWIYVIPVVAIHLAALAAFIPWLFSWTGVALAILGVPFYGMGITLGYHRLLAHRSLVLPKWLEHGFALLAQCSLQDTPRQVGYRSPDAPCLFRRTARSAQPARQLLLVALRLAVLSQHGDAIDQLRCTSMHMIFSKTRSTCAWKRSFICPAIYLGHLLIYPIAGALIGWLTTGTADRGSSVQPQPLRLGRIGADGSGLACDVVGELADPSLRLSQLRDQ